MLAVHKVGGLSSGSLVLETLGVPGKLLVPSPGQELGMLVLKAVKDPAAANPLSTEREGQGSKRLFIWAATRGAACNWVCPPMSILRGDWNTLGEAPCSGGSNLLTLKSTIIDYIRAYQHTIVYVISIMDDLASCG